MNSVMHCYRIDRLDHKRRDTTLMAAELMVKGMGELMKETGILK
jgi:hypothetical protein